MESTRKQVPTFSWANLKKEIASSNERLTLFGSEANKQTGTAWKDLTRSEKIKMIADRANIDAVTEEMVMGVMAADEFSSSVWTITPSMADVLLKANVKNRILRRNRVQQYKIDLANGDWKQNGESICFEKNGQLSDGQHRLAAISEAGVELRINVAVGCDSGSGHTYDCGLNRTTSDNFRYYEVPYYLRVASVVNRYFALSRKVQFVGSLDRKSPINNRSAGITRSALLLEYKESEALYQDAVRTASKIYNIGRVLSVAEVGGMIVYLVKDMGYRYDFVENFFVGLVTDGWVYNRAVADLRVKFVREAMNKNKRTAMTRPYRQALIIKAWNMYASGRDNARLSYDNAKEGKIWFRHA